MKKLLEGIWGSRNPRNELGFGKSIPTDYIPALRFHFNKIFRQRLCMTPNMCMILANFLDEDCQALVVYQRKIRISAYIYLWVYLCIINPCIMPIDFKTIKL